MTSVLFLSLKSGVGQHNYNCLLGLPTGVGPSRFLVSAGLPGVFHLHLIPVFAQETGLLKPRFVQFGN